MSSFCASGLVNLSTGSARELWVTCPLKTSQIPLVTCDGEGPVANEGPQEMGTRKQQVNALAPNKSRRRGEQPKDLAVDGMTKVINDLPFYPPPPLQSLKEDNEFSDTQFIHFKSRDPSFTRVKCCSRWQDKQDKTWSCKCSFHVSSKRSRTFPNWLPRNFAQSSTEWLRFVRSRR